MPKHTRPRTATGQFYAEPLADRFWSNLDMSGECWVWTGSTVQDGYGVVHKAFPGSGYTVAHRVSWFLKHGEVPDGILRHKCDNPPCVNPDHLEPGTQADNIADKMARGRQAKGERIGTAKITADDVLAIRRRTMTPREVMAHYGLSKTHAHRLLNGGGWAHLR